MTCRNAQNKLPGYLDGALAPSEQAALARHLSHCSDCRSELAAVSRVSALLARTERATPPADLALRIRLAVSAERNRESWLVRAQRRVRLAVLDILKPLAVPATGGVLMSFAVYCLILQGLLMGVPLGGYVPNDQPINLIQPARLQTLSSSPVHVDGPWRPLHGSNVSMVEFRINSSGRAFSYQILSGQADLDTRRELDRLMLFSSFSPELSFGRPTEDGRVVVRFDELDVQD